MATAILEICGVVAKLDNVPSQETMARSSFSGSSVCSDSTANTE